MSDDKPKPIGFIKNIANEEMVHLVYSGGQLSRAFPGGHVLEMVVEGDVPYKEFEEKDLNELIHKDAVKFVPGDIEEHLSPE